MSTALIGIDPGSRWTAVVLRVGDDAVNGATVGPGDDVDALNDVDNMAAVGRYIARVLQRIDQLYDQALKVSEVERVRVGVELVRVPVGWMHGRRSSIQLIDWLIPKQVTAAILGMYPDCRIVLPARHGRRELVDYPLSLQRRRPPDWAPNEAPRGERDHERAAYDIAGVAGGMA